ncbi:hypothetical protein OAF45_01590 [Candidatus Latescibacteria bacterium]|nr:hypothetical protein [Candidatus Latescibacterota bacterium]
MTSFTRIVVVLSFLRTAIGTDLSSSSPKEASSKDSNAAELTSSMMS